MKKCQPLSRRQFLAGSLAAAAALGYARTSRAAGIGKEPNPFAYDVESFARTEPKLVQYAEVSRFACPCPEPRRICIDRGDRVYVAAANGVSVLDLKGARVRELATADKARCVAAAEDGTIYVGLREHVECFDAKGQRKSAWESPGKRPWFTGIATNGNEVFVADAGNRVVLRYDRSGKLLGRIGEKNKDKNVPGLIIPSPYLDVALGADGLLRVNNPGRHRVELYTAEGDLELFWGKAGAGIQSFCGCCNPVGITLLPDGRCITCEKGLPRVKIYSADGAFECVVAGPESFPQNARAGSTRDLSDGTMGGLDAAVDSQGRIYVLDLIAADVRVMARKAAA